MPDAAQSVPLFGFGVGVKSSNVSAQMRINVYCEVLEDQDKTKIAYFARPGLLSFGAAFPSLPFNGCFPLTTPVTEPSTSQVTVGPAYFSGGALIQYSPLGALVATTPVFAGVGRVRVATLGAAPIGTPLAVSGIAVSGSEAATVSIGATGTATAAPMPVGSAFPLGTGSITVVASRFVAVDPSAIGRFRWSAVGDGSTWNALDFATADSVADELVGVFEAGGELLLFGSNSLEFWAPYAGGASGQQPFIRVAGSTLQWGCEAIDTICKTGRGVTFLGSSNGGNPQVVALSGYQAEVVSTPEVEASILASGAWTGAAAFFCVTAGHQFYVLNLQKTSWAYDLTTQTWSQWQTSWGRFAGQYACASGSALYVSDASVPALYTLSPSYYADGGALLTRQVISRHAWTNLARLSLREVAIDCETGVGLDGIQQGTIPQLMLQWSKDGGHTWGNEAWVTLGAIGRYLARAVWRGLGRSRDWVFRLTVTDPVKVVVIDAAAIFSP